MRRAARMAVAQVITFGLVMSPWMLGQQPELKSGTAGNSGADRPSKETLTGEVLFAKVVEHNLKREANLKYYSGSRHYCAQDKQDKVRAELDAVVEFQAPGPKQFNPN